MKRVLRGSRREETARFVAFGSHWRFEAEFCTPAAGHEKGGVESEVGRFRRNHWVPIPRTGDLEELNRHLLAACQRDEARTIAGREQGVGTAMLIGRALLLPLAEDGFDLVEASFPVVTSLGCVKVKTNASSVPVKAGSVESETALLAKMMQFRNLAPTGLSRRFKRASMVHFCAVVGDYTSLTGQLGKM